MTDKGKTDTYVMGIGGRPVDPTWNNVRGQLNDANVGASARKLAGTLDIVLRVVNAAQLDKPHRRALRDAVRDAESTLNTLVQLIERESVLDEIANCEQRLVRLRGLLNCAACSTQRDDGSDES